MAGEDLATHRAVPKVGVRNPGFQGNKEKTTGTLDRERSGGKGFRFPPLGKEKAKDIISLLQFSPAPRAEPDRW